MDFSDIRVDLTHDDATGPSPQDLTGRGERPGTREADVTGDHVSPTQRHALVGNPRRVRL